MVKPIKLQELVEEMDMQMDECTVFVDKKAGKLISISDEIMRKADEEELDPKDFLDWQRDEVEAGNELMENSNAYLHIPSKFDIHEYSIMEEFAASREPSQVSDQLSNAIRGSGAFRRFKDKLYDLGIVEEWYKYKDERLKQIAREWCEHNGVEYEE